MNIISLKTETDKIKDFELKFFIEKFIEEKVPDYIEEIPASSSGKYHPNFDNGKGGLIRHLKMCVLVAEELFRLDEYSMVDKDVIICGCFMHDLFKNGNADCGYTINSHDDVCANELYFFYRKNEKEISEETKNKIQLIESCIRGHMGQWGVDYKRNKEKFISKENQLVALCDYIASRKFFDKTDSL